MRDPLELSNLEWQAPNTFINSYLKNDDSDRVSECERSEEQEKRVVYSRVQSERPSMLLIFPRHDAGLPSGNQQTS